MQDGLLIIADDVIDKLRRKMKSLTPAQRLSALKDLKPAGVSAYKEMVLDAMVVVATDALTQARKEVPKKAKINLAATNIDKLPPALRKKLLARNELLVGRQVSDLMSVISFAYATNEDTTDSDDQVLQDLRESAVGFIDGTAIEAGSGVAASALVNDAREAFFFDDEVLDEIDAFEFVNGDPVSPVCQDLAGTVFDKNDPNLFRYTPPLHWNCKSYIQPVLKGNLGNRQIENLRPSTREIEQQIQFSENGGHERCCQAMTFAEVVDHIHRDFFIDRTGNLTQTNP